MIVSKKGFWFLVMCVLFDCVIPLQAVIIPLDDSGWAMVVDSNPGEVDFPFIYGVTDDAVSIQLDKVFDRAVGSDGFFDPIVIEFQKVSPDATANIIIRDEYIVNDTDIEWFDFHMHLIVSIMDPQAGFNPDFLPDGDQLEDAYYSTNYGYDELPIQLHFVDADGSGVPALPAGDDIFRPGHIAGQIVIVTNPQMEVGERFGLKEVPSIPEPTTLLLLGIGGLMAFRSKRRPA